MMGLLDSKTIIITGGSVGIGSVVANKCASEGAEVIIVARNKKDLDSSLNNLKTISDKNHRSYSLDVKDLNAIKAFANWLENEGLIINGLVNCAGVYGPIGKTIDVDMGKFTETININFLGTVYMCTMIAPMMKNNVHNKIINYSGGGAASPFPHYSAYATSKVAIVRFTENFSRELDDDGFDINCIAPGFVITRLHQETIGAGPEMAGSGFFENTQKQIEDGGVPPEKAAKLTVFLLSQDSDGITGKFLSAPWDPWQEKSFQERLREDDDFATLRRIDDKFFYKKNDSS